MKHLFLRAAASALALTAAIANAQQPAPSTATPATATATATATAKPTYGSYGFDAAGMDPSVKPGDDFYLHANGTWAKNTPIPADKSNYGAFNTLDELSRARTRAILETAKDYASYLDTAAVEAKGLAPIKPWLGEIKGVKDKAGYALVAAKAARAGISGPFRF